MISNLNNQKVLVRVDFNVPLDANFNITDDTRIRAAVPTLQHIIAQGGSPILMSHLGRPLKKLMTDGSPDRQKFTLAHLVAHLSTLMSVKVHFAADCIGEIAETAARNLPKGEILLLENTRFYAQEEAGDRDFAQALAKLGTTYINDAFGTAHRAHASTAVLLIFIPKKTRILVF
jgi:phosphoglycerate kinase